MPCHFRPRTLAAILLAYVLVLPRPARADLVVGTFEDQYPGVNAFRNDFRPTNSFTTFGFTLNNNYNATFDSWSGVSVSSKIDNSFGGLDYSHLYGAYAPLVAGGTGAGGSATYGVVDNYSQGDAYINLPDGANLASIDVANSTYTAQAITQGDSFARAFHAGDYLRLDILGYTGLNGAGIQIGIVPVFLADYRGTTASLLSNWKTVDLSSLAHAKSLEFSLTSTDVGPFGMNTPAVFVIDNITSITPTASVPEPSQFVLVTLGLIAAAVRYGRRERA